MQPTTSPTLLAFGGVAASGPSGPVDLGGPKQRAVLALLLVDPGVVVPLDRLVDRIWAGEPPARAEVSIRGYVSNLRKALGTAGFDPETVLEFRDRGYVLQVTADAIDLQRFDDAVEDARRLERLGDIDGARRHLEAALDLYVGDALGSAAEELDLIDVRARYEDRRGEAVEALADVRLAQGDHAGLPADLAPEIARQPYRERLRAQQALALYRAGRPVDALRALDEARRQLVEDIGVDPGPELRDLEAAILAHDDAVLAWSGPPGSAPVAPPVAPPATGAAPVAAGPPRFGRAGEEAQVRVVLDRLPGRGGVLVVSGEAGIGKSTLLHALEAEAQARGLVVAWDRCPESAAGAPYRSWRSLAEVLLPGETMQHDERAPEDERAGALLATQLGELARLRSRDRPAVLVVDDLQWSDDASLAMLEFLAPELERLQLLLAVGVRRSGAAELPPAVRDCLVELGRTGDAVHLTLPGLGAADVADWIASLTGAAAAAALVAHVMATTEGNPFFVRELLALLEADGLLTAAELAPGSRTIPHAVQDVVRRRTSRLPPDTQAMLSVAAVIGRRFDLDVLAGVLDLTTPDALVRLEPALEDGVVEPDDVAVGRFAFSHALVSSTLVAEQNAARLAAHHARTVAVIEAIHAADLDPWVEDLAHHAFEGLLAGTAAQAVDYAERAAAAAQAAQSSGDVATHLEHAVAATAMLRGFPPEGRLDLMRRLGVAQRDAGDDRGRATLLEAARLAEAQGDVELVAAILGGLNVESLWAGHDWHVYEEKSMAVIERALGTPGLSERARVLLTAGLAGELVYLDPVRAVALFAEAHDAAGGLDDAVLSARILLQWFWSVSGPSGQPVRASIGAQLVALDDAGSLPPRLRPLAHLAQVAAAIEVGDIDLARSAVARAKALAHPVRTPTGWAHLVYAETGLAQIDGDVNRARDLVDALRPALMRVRRYTADSTPASLRIVIETEAGNYDEALHWLDTLEPTPYAIPIQWARAWVLAEAGRPEDARAALARFDGPLPDDWLWVPLTTFAVTAAAAVGDERFLGRHLADLEPARDRFAMLGEGGMVAGPVALALAAGHVALGDPETARPLAREGLDLAERIGAVRWIPRARALLESLGG